MANPEHVEILKSGVVGWNRWKKAVTSENRIRKGLPLVHVDLAGIKLRWLDDYGAVDFSNTNLAGSDLQGATFDFADLSHATLCDSKCSRVRFNRAD